MTPRQTERFVTALERGYRTKWNGERIALSGEIIEQFEMKVRAHKAKRGIVIWPSFHAGTARRFGNRYVTENQYKTLISEPETVEA